MAHSRVLLWYLDFHSLKERMSETDGSRDLRAVQLLFCLCTGLSYSDWLKMRWPDYDTMDHYHL